MAPHHPLLPTQLAAQAARGEPPAAVFTDLDGTFVVDGADEAAARVVAEARDADWPLIAITGRSIERLEREVRSGELPPFSALVGAVGTEIRLRDGNGYIPDPAYNTALAASYDCAGVRQAAEHIVQAAPQVLQLVFQEPKQHEPFKISLCFMAATSEDIVAVLRPFQYRLPQLKLIMSEELEYNGTHPGQRKKYNLDIVPASKSDAIRYLMKAYGIQRGIVAGDSGNDIDALLVPGLIAVLVGGHQPKAYEAMRRHYPNAPPGAIHQIGSKHVFIDTHATRQGPESILLAMQYLRAQRR